MLSYNDGPTYQSLGLVEKIRIGSRYLRLPSLLTSLSALVLTATTLTGTADVEKRGGRTYEHFITQESGNLVLPCQLHPFQTTLLISCISSPLPLAGCFKWIRRCDFSILIWFVSLSGQPLHSGLGGYHCTKVISR